MLKIENVALIDQDKQWQGPDMTQQLERTDIDLENNSKSTFGIGNWTISSLRPMMKSLWILLFKQTPLLLLIKAPRWVLTLLHLLSMPSACSPQRISTVYYTLLNK